MANQKKFLNNFVVSTLIALSMGVALGSFTNSMFTIRAIRVIGQDGYAVGSVKLVRWWQVSGELNRARQDQSDPTLKIRVCSLRKGEIPQFVQLEAPEDKMGRWSSVNDRRICDTRV